LATGGLAFIKSASFEVELRNSWHYSIDIHTPRVYRPYMATKPTNRYGRVNVTLPRETLSLIDRVTQKTNRSAFLDRAVRFYVAEAGRENLKKSLRVGAHARSDRDRAVVEEWFPVEHGT